MNELNIPEKLIRLVKIYAVRKSGVQTTGTIFYKSVQLMAYADDIVIIGRSLASIKEAFQLLEEASNKGLVINKGKTKYMVAANTQNCIQPCTIEMGRYNYERVDSFTCLGSLVTGNNSVSEEITNCPIAANRIIFWTRTSVFTYATETWTITKKDERRLSIFKKENSLHDMWSNMQGRAVAEEVQ